jgi:hypothetical protein
MKQEDESLLNCSALSQYSSNALDDLVYLNLLPNKEAKPRGARERIQCKNLLANIKTDMML